MATPGPTVFIYHAMSQGRGLCTLNTPPDKGVSLTAKSNPYLMTEHLQDMKSQRNSMRRLAIPSRNEFCMKN